MPSPASAPDSSRLSEDATAQTLYLCREPVPVESKPFESSDSPHHRAFKAPKRLLKSLSDMPRAFRVAGSLQLVVDRDAMIAQGRPLAIVALLADAQELSVGLDRLS